MSDDYADWEDLVEERPGRAEPRRSLDDLLHLPDLPDELRGLVLRRSELRRRMESLTGGAGDEISRRDAARFAVPKHTAQSRIDERQARRREERRRLATLARLQRALVARRREGAAETRRRAVAADRVTRRREAEREAVVAADRERRRRERESARHDWQRARADERDAARAERDARRRWEERRDALVRRTAVERVLARRQEERELERRLDRPPLAPDRTVRGEGSTGRDRTSGWERTASRALVRDDRLDADRRIQARWAERRDRREDGGRPRRRARDDWGDARDRKRDQQRWRTR